MRVPKSYRAIRRALVAGIAITTVSSFGPVAAQSRVVDKGGMEYARLPVGSFQMGCASGDTCEPDESPAHEVRFARSFLIGKTEVSVSAYAKFAKATNREMPAPPEFNPDWKQTDQPIVRLKWEDAAAYCAWSGGRLPSEAEWEYASRGGLAGKKFPWGDDPPACRPGAPNGARFDDEAACSATPGAPSMVGVYGRNAYGLADLTGNAWEWVQDNHHETYEGAPSDGASWIGPGLHVLRGGSWIIKVKDLRLSNRYRDTSGQRYLNSGVRCARDTN